MNNEEKIMVQIKILCSVVTKNNYQRVIQQSYELVSKLCDLGVEKEVVYQSLFQYYQSLEDDLVQDCVADILDFIVSWCSPQKRIWKF